MQNAEFGSFYMNNLENIKNCLAVERPVAWDSLPDIDLYMDQVLSYMRRQLYSSRPESNVTAAMVNNYIRDGILPRTNDKKYSRSHIARLTTICVLKQVLAVGDISLLFSLFDESEMKDAYEKYRAVLDSELSSVMENVPSSDDEQAVADAIVRFSIKSYANKLAAEQLLDMVKESKGGKKEKLKDKEKKK